VSLRFYSYDERPELEERKVSGLEIWPAFMLESEVSNRCWRLLYERFGAFQHFLHDEEADEVVAEVNSVPVRVEIDDLPDRGWEDVLERGTAATEEPTAVTAIAVAIRPSRLGQGLSRTCLERMRDVAGEHGFHDLVAPVRPSWKPRYPLVPIDRYVAWTTADGHPFDPWLRTHAKLGASIIRPCHHAMRVEGTVSQWEEWAGMAFPESGDFVVPGALTLVSIDREADRGLYVEPNVWMRHRI
jgi:GNAT superfamily N-acetyltransferase